jgi:hypothetical protein
MWPRVLDHHAVVRQRARLLQADLAAQAGDALQAAGEALDQARIARGRLDAERHRVPAVALADDEARAAEAGMGAHDLGTCSGRTNMPRTFAAWSARPIQPLMRRLVRPQGEAPAARRRGRRWRSGSAASTSERG